VFATHAHRRRIVVGVVHGRRDTRPREGGVTPGRYRSRYRLPVPVPVPVPDPRWVPVVHSTAVVAGIMVGGEVQVEVARSSSIVGVGREHTGTGTGAGTGTGSDGPVRFCPVARGVTRGHDPRGGVQPGPI